MIRGESYTIALNFNAEYDKSRIDEMTLSIGNYNLCSLSGGTITNPSGNLFYCYISGENTSILSIGERAVVLAVKDSTDGTRKAVIANLPIQDSGNQYANEVDGETANLLLDITYSTTNLIPEFVIADVYLGAGIPANGATNQILRKKSASDYDAEWSSNLDDIDIIALNTSVDPSNLSAGQVQWDDAEGTISFGITDGGVIQIGKEVFEFYTNMDSVALVNGDIVSLVTTPGNRRGVKRTNPADKVNAENVIGMVTVPSISPNAVGRITKIGSVHELNTNAYEEGTKLYVSVVNPGKWTATPPDAPNVAVYIGSVAVKNSSVGVVDLAVGYAPSLSNLSDVDGISGKRAGQVLGLDANLNWKNIDNPTINKITPEGGTLDIDGEITPNSINTGVLQSTNVQSSGTVTATEDVKSSSGFVEGKLGIKKTGKTDDSVLLAAGGDKPLTDFQLKSEKGQANGYASLDSSGKVPSTQLPSYVDDIVAGYATFSAPTDPHTITGFYEDEAHTLPISGEVGKIYIDLSNNWQFRWNVVFVYLEGGAVQSVAGKTGIVTLAKGDVGLGNVDNTSDADKPVSNAQAIAIGTKVSKTGNETIEGIKTFNSSPIVPTPTTDYQAATKKYADDTFVPIAGDKTITGIKTFSSSPIVPTPTGDTDAANKGYVTSQVIANIPASTAAMHPDIAFHQRVLADVGTVRSKAFMQRAYEAHKDVLSIADRIYIPEAGVKNASGKVETLYDLSANSSDATQATAGSRFYLGNIIADNEKASLKSVIGMSAASIGFAPVAKAGTDYWSLLLSFKPNCAPFLTKIGADLYFTMQDGTIAISTGSVNVMYATYTPIQGVNMEATFVYQGGRGYISVNGVLLPTVVASVAVSFGRFEKVGELDGQINYFGLFNDALSASQAKGLYSFLSTEFPAIETIAVGSQQVATSNLEATVFGSTTIPEVQGNSAWAALTTPAWSHYNNSTDNGAIYGKLMNGYAVDVIEANKPKGFHVPSELEWTQLSESLGGNTVSGGKMKALYGGFDNAFATNESGVSLLAGGERTIDGQFAGGYLSVREIENKNWYIFAGGVGFGQLITDMRIGASVRLFSDTPHLTTMLYESGWFSTDIASSAKVIRIPFGCRVKSITTETTTNVTAIEAKLFNYAGTELETLITGKACNATKKSFTVTADQTVSFTDNYVRITASGNSGKGMNIIVTIEQI